MRYRLDAIDPKGRKWYEYYWSIEEASERAMELNDAKAKWLILEDPE